jgi:hypothetical protein
MDEVNALKAKTNLTTQERQELESRLETLQKDSMTKEELAAEKIRKLDSEYKKTTETLSKEKEGWQKRFTDSTINQSIVGAAAENNAFSTDQILAILRPNAHLVEVLDGEGKPSGELVAKITFHDTKDGKPITLELTPSEAVKKMREMDKFLNLFKSEGAGGLGMGNRPVGKQADLKELVKRDTAGYIEGRKAGKIKFPQ